MSLRRPSAVVFDLDGVLVDTARLHFRAWKQTFDRFFDARGVDDRFDEVEDYRRHVDGRPRYEGVAAMLESREIELPEGDPEDDPGFDTQAAVGNLKNTLFHDLIDSEGVQPLEGAQALLEALDDQGIPMAVVSSSRNAARVLPEELGRHIDVLLGGDDIARLGLAGKPEPDMFIESVRRLGVDPRSAAVLEDAPAGVRAGRRGDFGVVVGIDPAGTSGLDAAGADVVVPGVSALPTDPGEWPALIGPPPGALASMSRIGEVLSGKPAVFLDYDGTLTPIVDDPEMATIGSRERSVLEELARRVPVAIVSGRALADVKRHVGIEGLTYSGSHGFEIELGDGTRSDMAEAAGALPQLDEAERMLVEGADSLPGVSVERKPYAIALHTRRAQTPDARESAGVLAAEVASRLDGLVLRGGKEIHEIRPAMDWDKGAALGQLIDLLPGEPVPLYIGDDETDEDAFLAVRRLMGVGILVGTAEGADTWADFTLDDTGEVLEFLSALSGVLTR